MAYDFAVMMKEWRRMCDYYTDRYDDNACEHCELYNKMSGCDAVFSPFWAKTNWNEFGDTVTEWAEAHKKPVYPTWYEWLETILDPEITKYQDDDTFLYALQNDRIPANIAQKLGLKPKEN